MTKKTIILVEEIEDYLEFVRLYRELQCRLTLIKESQERILQETEKLKKIATTIKAIKEKNRFETDVDMAKLIRRYAKNG
jgi:hypothetical protein